MKRSLLWCVCGLLACVPDGAVKVLVQPQEGGLQSHCLRVEVTGATTGSATLNVEPGRTEPVDVVVVVPEDASGSIEAVARGYAEENCEGAVVEESAPGSGEVKQKEFVTVTLTLAPVPVETDGGTGGGEAGGEGGGVAGGAGGGEAGGAGGGEAGGTGGGATEDGGTDGGSCAESEKKAPCGVNGQCNSDGVCVPKFPFHSNFDDADVPVTDGGAVLNIDAPWTFDTEDAGWPDGGEFPIAPQDGGVLLIALDELSVSSTLTLVGDARVIFAVKGDATIHGAGVIIARNGANPPDCGAGTGEAGKINANNDRGGGGGGAGFGTDGGHGGVSGSASVALGGDGGALNGNDELVPLRGGCRGGTGGFNGGVGGSGGGALQMSVVGTATIAGVIAAPGFGGAGGGSSRGGGGGGSGGAVLLEATAFWLPASARVTANGGGGGGGGGSSGTGGTGGNGIPDSGTPAIGGAGGSGSTGSPGGAGGAGTTLPANGGGNSRGGGGGGGAVGRIRLNAHEHCIHDESIISPGFTGDAGEPDGGC